MVTARKRLPREDEFWTILIREPFPVQSQRHRRKKKTRGRRRQRGRLRRRKEKKKEWRVLFLGARVPVWGTIVSADNGAKKCRNLITTRAALNTALLKIKYATRRWIDTDRYAENTSHHAYETSVIFGRPSPLVTAIITSTAVYRS